MVGVNSLMQGGSASHNGQQGITGYKADNTRIIGVEIAHNNYAGFEDSWQAGGIKVTKSVGMQIRDNYVHHNNGTGIWSDIDMMNTPTTR
jgi:hypothetical protein